MVFKQHVQCPYHIVMVKQRLKMSPFESESMTLISTPMNEEEEEEKTVEEEVEEEEGGREGRQRNAFRKLYGHPKLQDHLADAFEEAQEC